MAENGSDLNGEPAVDTPLKAEETELVEIKNGKFERPEDAHKEPPQLQNSRYCTAILLLNVISSVPMINYGLTCLNPAIPVIKEMYNETYYARYNEYIPSGSWEVLKSLTMSMIVGGAFVGSITLKVVLHFLSRKSCMVLIHIVNIIGALIICLGAGLSKAWEPMIFGRFVMGLANGLALGLIPVIIGETCVKHRCARYDGLIGVCLACGALLGVILGWSQIFGTAQLWPLIIATPAIPSAIYLLISKWLPDTPQQVLLNGDRSELQKLMERLRDGPENAISAEIRAMIGVTKRSESLLEDGQGEEEESGSKDISLGQVLKNKQYRRQFVMVVLLFANLMLNGINNVFFFSDPIFIQAGISVDFVTVVTIFVFLFQVVATLPGSYILSRFGSWILCIIGNIIMILGHILIVASLATFEKVPAMSYMAVVGVVVYLLGFAGCENIGLFPLVGEITTKETRPICVNFGCATLWLTGWFVGFLATYFQIWLGAYSFMVWMAFTIFFTIYIVMFVPNTKGKTSEEIQKHFKKE